MARAIAHRIPSGARVELRSPPDYFVLGAAAGVILELDKLGYHMSVPAEGEVVFGRWRVSTGSPQRVEIATTPTLRSDWILLAHIDERTGAEQRAYSLWLQRANAALQRHDMSAVFKLGGPPGAGRDLYAYLTP